MVLAAMMPDDLIEAVEHLTAARFLVEGYLERAAPSSVAVHRTPGAIWLVSDLLHDEIEAADGTSAARERRTTSHTRRPGC